MPIGIGMLAHALRWEVLQAGASIQLATFAACLFVGVVVALAAHRLRVPFGAFAFASVVSMIPGVFMFQAAAEALTLIDVRTVASAAELGGVIRDGATACIILLAMTFGLIIPRMCVDTFVLRPRIDASALPPPAGERMTADAAPGFRCSCPGSRADTNSSSAARSPSGSDRRC
jgi:uncharacterized membrane protein YjjB (DUF3815 family)